MVEGYCHEVKVFCHEVKLGIMHELGTIPNNLVTGLDNLVTDGTTTWWLCGSYWAATPLTAEMMTSEAYSLHPTI
jgi:hypothetical protein